MCADNRGAAGVACVLQALAYYSYPIGARMVDAPPRSPPFLDSVRNVTEPLTRTSPLVIALVLGIAGIALAAGAYAFGAADMVLATFMGLYAIACSAFGFLVARGRWETRDDSPDVSLPTSEPSVVTTSVPADSSDLAPVSMAHRQSTSADGGGIELRDSLTFNLNGEAIRK